MLVQASRLFDFQRQILQNLCSLSLSLAVNLAAFRNFHSNALMMTATLPNLICSSVQSPFRVWLALPKVIDQGLLFSSSVVRPSLALGSGKHAGS